MANDYTGMRLLSNNIQGVRTHKRLTRSTYLSKSAFRHIQKPLFITW